jgi:SepF-like predicted cell division protein (DUF552 family)
MKNLFLRIKEKLSGAAGAEEEAEAVEKEEYVEVGPEAAEEGRAKIIVRPFSIEDFEDIKPILDSLREGYTIALINIKPLKERDLIELKRAINKLKKTTEAIEGDIAGFGEDYIVVTPSFASIHRAKETEEIKEDTGREIKEGPREF